MGSAMTLETLRDLLLHANATSMIGTHVYISVADAVAGVLAIDAHLADKAGARVDGWLPIESAPKVSRHVQLFGDGPAIEGCIYVGGWDELENSWRLVGGGRCYPTHWMPLPPGPAA